jgi:general secretion pathway protein D
MRNHFPMLLLNRLARLMSDRNSPFADRRRGTIFAAVTFTMLFGFLVVRAQDAPKPTSSQGSAEKGPPTQASNGSAEDPAKNPKPAEQKPSAPLPGATPPPAQEQKPPSNGQSAPPTMSLFDNPTRPQNPSDHNVPAQQPGGATAQPVPQASTPQLPNPPGNQPTAAVPSPASAENNQNVPVALNLENADLYQVLRIIGSELKINYMVDPAVKGTVTINTAGSISRADLFSVLESILQVNGAAIVKQGSYYRIVPAADAKVQPVPLEFAKSPEAPPTAGETLVLSVFPMHYASAAEMGKILAPFISPAGQVIVNERGNILLVLETPPKLKQVADLLHVFDSSTFSRQRVRLYQVSNNSAKNMIKELQDVFSGYSFTGTSAIRFVPVESLNAVLAISPDPEAFKDIEAWVHQLDQPPQQVGEQNFVYPVQNANASDLRDILIELYGGSVQKPQEKPVSVIPPNPMVSPAAIEDAEKAMTPQVPERVQGRLHILSDQKNNSLIIQASPHDYEIVKRTIAQLDILPRQVLIDAKVYSVDLTGDLSLGISYYLGQKSQLPGPVPLNTNGSFAAGQSPGSLLASTFAVLSQTRGLQMFLNATDQRSRVRMLSAPSILVTDNTSARIQVGASVPVPIGSALTPIQAGGSSIFAQTIQYQDTGVILTVTPHINASGVVALVLTQEVSSAIPNTTSGIVAPVINKSSFQTSVVLADGEPLALGGIITTTYTLSKDRIPGLGEIPIVGALFGNTTRKTERNEIVLILTPHVQQNPPQAAAQSKEFIDRMRETKKEMDKMN